MSSVVAPVPRTHVRRPEHSHRRGGRGCSCSVVPMKKLLVLAYDFPPYVSVGSLRPYSWYQYLHRFDVYPIVVTRQWDNLHGNGLDYIAPSESPTTIIEESETGTIIRTPYVPNAANKLMLKHGERKFRILRKSISASYEMGQFFLPVGPKSGLYRGAAQYLKENPVDAIIATGEPFVLFEYAAQLAQNYSLPWIADFRDPWSHDRLVKNQFYKAWCASLEKKCLKSVSKITTVSSFFQAQIEKSVKSKDFAIIYNGYNPEIVEATRKVTQHSDTLSIAFAGTVYDWYPLQSFFRVCEEILAHDPDFAVQLHFYGINKQAELEEMLRDCCPLLRNNVHFYPKMENLKWAQEMAKQNVFLLFNEYSYLGTKIYDYLALRRKILFCYENDEEAHALKAQHYFAEDTDEASKTLQADMIRATNSGLVIRDAAQLKDALLLLNAEMKENGFVACHSKGVEEYSRVRQVEKLAAIVHGLSPQQEENK